LLPWWDATRRYWVAAGVLLTLGLGFAAGRWSGERPSREARLPSTPFAESPEDFGLLKQAVCETWRLLPRRMDVRSGAVRETVEYSSRFLGADEDGIWTGQHLYHSVGDELQKTRILPKEPESKYRFECLTGKYCIAGAGRKTWYGGSTEIAGMATSGIYSYDPATASITSYTAKDGIPTKGAFAVVKTPGFLWFGTQDGLLRIRVLDAQPEAPQTEGQPKSGLPDEAKHQAKGEARR
jgi:hypothetical protein